MKRIAVIILASLIFFSCSINKIAMRKVSEALAGAGNSTVFTGDDDPELVASALPFALKMYEALLEQDPANSDLLLAAGTGFISYANAFVQGPADMLPQDAYEEKNAAYRRAKSLYLRGRDYTFRAIDVRHPDFSSSLASGDFEKAFTGFAHEDVPSLYYASAGIFGAFSCDTMDFELSFAIPRAFACAAKALELDETWNAGAVHELFVSLYGSLPEAMMFRVSEDEGKEDSIRDFLSSYYASSGIPWDDAAEKGRYHFERAVAASGNSTLSPYLSYARGFFILSQDRAGFEALLEEALAIDYDAKPENRLVNTLNARKAIWLLDHTDDLFLSFDE